MKVIDLLNKIANGEEVPNHIRYEVIDLYYNKKNNSYDLIMSNVREEFYTFSYSDLNNEVEIIEDTPKEDKKIEDTARFQYSQIPSWFDIKELIKAVNENFEKHQKALYEIIDKVNGR